MKIIIVYFSKTGHTSQVAHDLAKELHADVSEIKDKTNRNGILGWLLAGRDAMSEKLTQIGLSEKTRWFFS